MKRNHSPRKPFTPGKRPQQSLEQFMVSTVASVRSAFVVPVRITIAVRITGNAEAEVVFSDDDLPGLIETLQRRAPEVAAAQEAAQQAA